MLGVYFFLYLFPVSLAQLIYPNASTTVYLNLLINSLSAIDGVEEQFTCDFFLSAYWFDPNVDNNTDLNEFESNYFYPFIEFVNIVGGLQSTLENNYYVQPPDTIPIPANAAHRDAKYWVEYDNRFIANFKATLRLQDFPWDRQTASILLDSSQWDSSQVTFLPNTDDFASKVLPPGFEMVEWNLDTPAVELYFENAYYPIYQLNYSTFRIDVLVVRDPTYYVYKVVSGVVLLVYMAIFIYSLEVNSTDRMMGTITVFLAIITFVFIANDGIPKVSYQTRIDSFFTFSFFIVFSIFISHAVLYFYRPDEDDEKKPVIESPETRPKSGTREKRAFTMHTFHLPDFHELTKQRRADLILVILYAIGYAIGLGIIFLRPIKRRTVTV